MSCNHVQERISPLLDRQVPAGERQKLLAHIESCKKCGARVESLQNLRAAMRGMANPPVPSAMAARLRVTASHERSRQLARRDLGSRWHAWTTAVELWFDNLMRPVALPFAGGLLSALVMFSILVTNLSFHHGFGDQSFVTNPDGEVIVLSSTGSLAPSDYGEVLRVDHGGAVTPEEANVVWLTIDQYGNVSDYSVERGKLTPDLYSIIMLSRFTPATVLGLPTSGKIRVWQGPPERIQTTRARGSMRS